jgi:hypothetical protein
MLETDCTLGGSAPMAKHIVCLSFDYDVTSWHMPDEDAELASVT